MNTKVIAFAMSLLAVSASAGEVKIICERNATDQATTEFAFPKVPRPSANDAATDAKFSVIDGRIDPNSGGVETLNDKRLPSGEDQPGDNFFFSTASDGGRLQLDLGKQVDIKAVNTYSWHPYTRGAQVYKLYGSTGTQDSFNATPDRGTAPETCGWQLLAEVDSRKEAGATSGQFGVSVFSPEGELGQFRYLLFDIARTETEDPFGNTFFSEIDVVDKEGSAPITTKSSTFAVDTANGTVRIVFDVSQAPELEEWAKGKLAPILADWYPKIVEMLPSQYYVAPKEFRIKLRPGNDVAFAAGTSITANSTWLKRELDGEAVGALIHEVVHVVQHCNNGLRRNRGGGRAPGWVIEGVPDYIRWFKFEPQSHGAGLIHLERRQNSNFRYDAKYRITANFINYVVDNHDPEHSLIPKLSEACGSGTYSDELWKEITGMSLDELNEKWNAHLKARFVSRTPEGANKLTEAEQAAGWRLLFNGTDLTGWSNFKSDKIRPGWKVADGTMVCADPHDAGDLVTKEKFGAFELLLDYKIAEGGNSGIIFHVSEQGGAVWASGPEFQLEDNAKAADPQRCGWLYGLYRPPTDPQTGKPIDATLPAGRWNQIRLVVTPEKCEHYINDVKYFEYVLGSDDFKDRVARSKFASMPLFAKFDEGYIALQGDHGEIAFRNIKIRRIATSAAQ